MRTRFPKGIRAAVEKYAERIEQAVGLQVNWDAPLGCGSFGCVFPTSEEGKVLKISSDPTEGPVVKAVMDTKLDKQLEGLGRWYGVWKIPEPINTGPRSAGWVILREDVQPFSRPYDREQVFRIIPFWVDYLMDYNRHSRRSIDLKTKWKADREWENAQAAVGKLFNFEETYYIAEAIDALERADIRLADIHMGNLGHRIFKTEDQPADDVYWFDKKERPPLLIFDLGHSSAPEGANIDDLWNEAAKINPSLGACADRIRSV